MIDGTMNFHWLLLYAHTVSVHTHHLCTETMDLLGTANKAKVILILSKSHSPSSNALETRARIRLNHPIGRDTRAQGYTEKNERHS